MLRLPSEGGVVPVRLPSVTFDDARALGIRGALGRAGAVLGDVLGAVVMVLLVPLAILAVGLPIALVLRLILWMVGLV